MLPKVKCCGSTDILKELLIAWVSYADLFMQLILQYRVLSRKKVRMMMNMDIFQLFFNYLEERPYNNIHQNVKQDADYLEAAIQENKLNEQYQNLNLSDEQRKVIMQWTDAIQAQESAYTAVLFRMGIQLCFSLLMQLADL